MNGHCFPGLSVLQPSQNTQELEWKFEHAIVANNVFPKNANPTAKDIRLAFLAQFENQVAPIVISRFNSDFVIQFDNAEERDIVASSRFLQGHGFCMGLATWSSQYGGRLVDWQTKVTVDVTDIPPHAFDPNALPPLLEQHCSIQTCGFHNAKGISRVDAYALNTMSIPAAGQLAIQFRTEHGVRNIVFPVTIKTYPYNEAPDLGPDDCSASANPKAKAYYTDEEAGYDTDVLREVFENDLEAERQQNGFHAANNNSDSDYDSEGNYLRRQDSGFSIESDRSVH